MINFTQEYLNADKRGRHRLLRSYMHGIKHEAEADCFDYFNDFNFDLLHLNNTEDLVRLAVYINHAFAKRFKRVPKWCTDRRLILDTPYKGRGYHESWFFHGPQAMRQHNFFIDPGALEVM